MTAMETIKQAMDANRGMLLAMLADMDDKAMVFRPAGGRGNHALWLLGHVCGSEAHLIGWTGARIDVPPPAGIEKCAMGTTPVADVSAYPSKKALLDYAAAVRQQALAALAKVKAADMDKPAVNAPEFCKTRGQCWQLAVTHEMMHIGQLTVVRKELVMPPIFG